VNVAVVAPVPADTSTDREIPRAEYLRRKATQAQHLKALNASDNKIAMSRGILFLAFILLLIFSSQSSSIYGYWPAIPFVAFVALAIYHGRVLNWIRSSKQAVKYYQEGLKRINDEWFGVGPTGQRYQNSEHAYSSDLDLFGQSSLFQLISQSRTHFGEDTLAHWLQEPANSSTVTARQTAISELIPKIELREHLALLPTDSEAEFKENVLQEWLHAPAQPLSTINRIFAGLLGLITPVLILLYLIGVLGAGPSLIVILIQIPFLFRFREDPFQVGPRAKRIRLPIHEQVRSEAGRVLFPGERCIGR